LKEVESALSSRRQQPVRARPRRGADLDGAAADRAAAGGFPASLSSRFPSSCLLVDRAVDMVEEDVQLALHVGHLRIRNWRRASSPMCR